MREYPTRATLDEVDNAIRIGGLGVLPDVLSQRHLNLLIETLAGEARNQQSGPELRTLGYRRFGRMTWSCKGTVTVWLKGALSFSEKSGFWRTMEISKRLDESC